MGVNDSDFDRLAAGAVPTDDPQLGKVSAFLASLEAVYPSIPPASEERHLAVVAREARLVGASREHDGRRDAVPSVRTKLRRALATVSAGVLVALTAGVGVAAALGANPLQLVPDLLMKPWSTPGAAAPTPTTEPSDGATSPGNPDTTAGRKTPPSTTPTPTPTVAGNCGNGRGEGNATCTHGKSGEDNPGKGNHGKSGADKGKSDKDKASKDKAGKDNPGKDKQPGKGDRGKDPGHGKGGAADPQPGKDDGDESARATVVS